MKIIGFIKNGNRNLVRRLKKRGVEAKFTQRDTIIVDLPELGNSKYKIIPEIDESDRNQLNIDLSESGGATKKTGSAIIICSLGGKRLKPYLVLSGEKYSNKIHACFSVRFGVLTVRVKRNSDSVGICKYFIVRQNKVAQIITERIWQGPYEKLIINLPIYKEAAIAAIEKAKCYHCCEPHYIDDGVLRFNEKNSSY